MTHDDIEPLEPGVWLLRVRKLALRPIADDAALTVSLRHAFHLIQLAPPPWRQIVRCAIDENGLERLLEDGALGAAASAIMGERMNRGRDEVDSRPTPHDLFRAWIACLVVLDEAPVPGETWVSPPIRRKPQSARRPKSTEH